MYGNGDNHGIDYDHYHGDEDDDDGGGGEAGDYLLSFALSYTRRPPASEKTKAKAK